MTVLLTVSKTLGGADAADALAGGGSGVDLGACNEGEYAPIILKSANTGWQNLYIRHNGVNEITDVKTYIQVYSQTYEGNATAAADFTTLQTKGAASGNSANNGDGLSSGFRVEQDADLAGALGLSAFDGTRAQVKIYGKSALGISLATAYLIHQDAMIYNNAGTPVDATKWSRMRTMRRCSRPTRGMRATGQMNVLTYLIEHGDANLGNFLASRATVSPRVFSVDNGVAFAHNESDRSDAWKYLRVPRLPADTVARLRSLSREDLHRRLGVLAQWRLDGGRWVAEPPGANLAPQRGVRQQDGVVQLGLTKSEIDQVGRRITKLLKQVDEGQVALSEEKPDDRW